MARQCGNCGQTGHNSRTCTQPSAIKHSSAKPTSKGKRQCGNCGEFGHNARTCTKPSATKHSEVRETKPTSKGKRQCGNCGGYGHNARTCTGLTPTTNAPQAMEPETLAETLATLSPGERRKAKIAILKGMTKGERRKAKLELMRAKKEGLLNEPAPVKHRPPSEPGSFNLETGESATFASALAPTPRTWPKSAKGVCPICLEKGHTAKTCPKTEVPKLTKQELELIGHEETLKRFGSYPKEDNRRFFIYHPHKNFCYRMWQTATSEELTSRLSKEEIDRLQIRKPVFREGVRIVRLG